MTVEELIEKLRGLPPEVKVFVMCNGEYHRELKLKGLSDWHNGEGDLFNLIPYNKCSWMEQLDGDEDVFLEIEI
tara:strand:+ start:492 stop:713 length:222 start_codon:yes stop_codon:yes gene_type:complete